MQYNVIMLNITHQLSQVEKLEIEQKNIFQSFLLKLLSLQESVRFCVYCRHERVMTTSLKCTTDNFQSHQMERYLKKDCCIFIPHLSMIGGSGGAIYLPYLVLHHTAWSNPKGMSTFWGLVA